MNITCKFCRCKLGKVKFHPLMELGEQALRASDYVCSKPKCQVQALPPPSLEEQIEELRAELARLRR